MNDEKYWFPGKGKSFYVLTLSGHCENCDASTGISIELMSPGDFMFEKQNRDDFTRGELQFADWHDSKGVGINCGMLKHEFVKKLLPELVGIDSNQMGENGKIDEDGAEVILEDMYGDAQVRPSLVAGRP